MRNIIISKPKELAEINKNMAKDGAKKLHILADFDRTLTTLYNNGKKIFSLMSLLDHSYLTPTYHRKYQEIHDKYFPIELNTKIESETKKKLMAEWWQKVFDLLIESKLNKKDLKRLVISQKIRFRNGFNKFVDFLKNKNIPLIIMSSTGLGGETISMSLKKESILYSNIYVIANNFEWDKNGYAIKIKKPIIHIANKDETILKNFPVFDKIKERRNIILLGDVIEDVKMASGFNYKNLIKIGFLNEKIDKNLNIYKKYYDIVITNDSNLQFVNKLLKKICS